MSNNAIKKNFRTVRALTRRNGKRNIFKNLGVYNTNRSSRNSRNSRNSKNSRNTNNSPSVNELMRRYKEINPSFQLGRVKEFSENQVPTNLEERFKRLSAMKEF